MHPHARALLVLLGSLGACTPSAQFHGTTGPGNVGTADPESVEVLSLPPGRPYLEVGTVDVVLRGFSSQQDMLTAMKQVAAARGCNAIVLRHPESNHAACLIYNDK